MRGENISMLRLIAIVFIFVLLLPALVPQTLPTVLTAMTGRSEAWAQADRTELMQQSDHKRRGTQQKAAEPVEQQMAGVVTPDGGAGGEDYAVLAILVASVVVLAFVASRRKKTRLRL